MKERLKKIRTTLGFNQQEMAEKLGFELTTYRSFEYKSKNFPIEFLTSLIYTFSININWLLTGYGNMFMEKESQNEENDNIFSFEEIKILKKLVHNIKNY